MLLRPLQVLDNLFQIGILAILVSGCARLPSAPESPRPSVPAGIAAQASEPPAYAATQVIARLHLGVLPNDLAASYASSVLGYVSELRLVLFRTPAGMSAPAFVTRLSADPRVEFSEFDYAFQTAEGRQSTIAFSESQRIWSDVVDQEALRRVGAAAAQSLVAPGPILVAILDTGIELDHPVLAAALSLPGIERGVTVSPGDDRAEQVDTNGDGIVDGALGHGTHVAGIVRAIAPAATLLPVRVLDSDGVGYAFDIAHGLAEAERRGAAIANLSLGLNGYSRAVCAALDYAAGLGLLVVAPAGNENLDRTDFPASYPTVVTVAGTDPLDHKAAFSNYGPGIDLAAPAAGILSTSVGGGYARWSGTSMAAPFVSGTAAVIYGALGSRGPLSMEQVAGLLRSGAMPLDIIDPDYGRALGAGRVSVIGSVSHLIPVGGDPFGDPDPHELLR